MQPTRSTQTNTTQATRSSQTNTTQATRSSQTNTTQATRSSQTNTTQATRSSQTNTTQATRLFAQNYTTQPTLLPHSSLPLPTQSPQGNTTQLPTRSPAGSGSFPGQLHSGRSSGQTYAGHHSTTPSPKVIIGVTSYPPSYVPARWDVSHEHVFSILIHFVCRLHTGSYFVCGFYNTLLVR